MLKTFVVTIREINTHGGIDDFFEKYPVGGMYFGGAKLNLDENGNEMGTATTVEKLNKCKNASKNKLLVCADGAFIQNQSIRLRAKQSLGASLNLEDAYELGKIIGMQMNANGVDWVLGPSIDLCLDHLMYLEAISDDPQVIVDINRNVIRGIQDQGVCATVKHFPGLGTGFMNMHVAPGANNLPFDEWMNTYGYVYKQMFEENVMSVMTTHTKFNITKRKTAEFLNLMGILRSFFFVLDLKNNILKLFWKM